MTRDEVLAEVAEQLRQHPEWALIVENPRFFRCPKDIITAEDAFTALGHYLWCVSKPPVPVHLDQKLAAFVKANPGRLEELINDPEHLLLLARAQGGADAEERRLGKRIGGCPQSLLEVFLSGQSLPRMLAQLEPLRLLESCLQAQTHFQEHYIFCGITYGLPGVLIQQHGRRLVRQAQESFATTVPQSFLDVLNAVVQKQTYVFPEILVHEEDLALLTPDEIRATLAHYRGMSAEVFNTHLIQRGFLAEGEHVGEVIHRDAETLLKLGTSRHQLAKALQRTMLQDNVWVLPWRRSLDIKVQRWRGHHQDPFHLDDTYYLSSEVGGSADVTVRNRATGEQIAFGSMLPYLIRRACFFEGAVPYRLDPAAACRVLEPLLRGAFVYNMHVGDV